MICEARRERDGQYRCERCRVCFDLDEEPPCKTDQEIQDDINRRGMKKLKSILNKEVKK